MEAGVSDEEARDALATIESRRRRVIDEIDAPQWYWWGLAVGWIALANVAAGNGSRHPVTVASIAVAVLILLGGPRLMATVRRRIARASAPS